MITLILILCFSLLPAPSAFAENIYYGQIINSGTYLYKDTKNNLIFELPQTYFVKISGYKSGHYIAEYMGTKGYVKCDNIKVVRGTPKCPYLTTSTFRLFASDYNKLKLSPNILSKTLTSLPVNTPIKYIATSYGEELVENRGNAWYYCEYRDGKSSICGYVYAGLCDGLIIEPNTETFEYIANPYVSPSTEYIEYLSSDGKMLVIAPVVLVSILFIPLLFLPKFVKNFKRKPSTTFVEDGKI